MATLCSVGDTKIFYCLYFYDVIKNGFPIWEKKVKMETYTSSQNIPTFFHLANIIDDFDSICWSSVPFRKINFCKLLFIEAIFGPLSGDVSGHFSTTPLLWCENMIHSISPLWSSFCWAERFVSDLNSIVFFIEFVPLL